MRVEEHEYGDQTLLSDNSSITSSLDLTSVLIQGKSNLSVNRNIDALAPGCDKSCMALNMSV